MKGHEKFMKEHDYYTALGIYTEMQAEAERLLKKRNLVLAEVKRHLAATVVFEPYGSRPVKVDFEGLKKAIAQAEGLQRELEAVMAEANRVAEACERARLSLEDVPFRWDFMRNEDV